MIITKLCSHWKITRCGNPSSISYLLPFTLYQLPITIYRLTDNSVYKSKGIFNIGEKLRFKRNETGYVVYSVGQDKIDNNGLRKDKDDYDQEEYDLVFEKVK